MGPSWIQALLRCPLLLQAVWALLSSVCCSHGPPRWRFISSEIVIPRKVPQRRTGDERTGQLSYSMRFQGRRHILHMKVKKSLLPRDVPVITSNDQGAMQQDYPFIPRDCYYLSYLEGVPGSMATLDTCYGGIRGMLQVDDLTYEIKPLETSSRFEHVVSLLVADENLMAVERCPHGEEDINQALEEEQLGESPRAGPVYNWLPHWKQFKIHYTISHSLYLQNPNFTNIVENIVIMNNILDSIYQMVYLHVFVRAINIWDQRDQSVLRPDDMFKTMVDYGMWKSRVYVNFPHDISVLLTAHAMGTTNYYSFVDSVCNPHWGGVHVQVVNYHIFLASTITAHSLGHGYRLKHDVEGCRCFRRSSCVMAPVPGLLDSMSNCSYADIYSRVYDWDGCLFERNVPFNNFPYIAPRCGNKIIDQGEECDCGSFKECSEDKCCLTNCVMTSGTVCMEGDCCHECKYFPPGKICRDIRGICDLPEYCDGKTPTCPADTYVQDGTPCSPLAVCMRGNCSDRDMQCQALFGYGIKDGPPVCYQKLNLIGDRFGNCGLNWTKGGIKPLACDIDDVFCGMLHCGGIKQVPGGGDHTTFRQIIVYSVKEELCFGYDVHFGLEKVDMALVVDGSTCGPGRYCLKYNCTYFQDLNFNCNVSKCNYRGVCNNQGNCHCLRGWKPPYCAEAGGGGSVDSGPPPDKEGELRARVHGSVNMMLSITFGRLMFFLGSFTIGVLSQIKATIQRRTKFQPVAPK
ncbi:disintegrin and metalloproteinase domain-containing protein 21-like [Rhynchocyon petersi]